VSDPVLFEFRGTRVRTVLIDGEPWFVAADVCAILDYSNGPDAIRKHVPARRTRSSRIATPGAVPFQDMTVISEPGLYRLVMRSNQPDAEAFQDWVTDEVLPTIRRTGSYAAASYAIPQDYPAALELAAKVVRELEASEQARRELEPAAHSWTTLADAGGDYSLRQAAQILDRDPVISTGQNRLSAYLRGIGWLDSGGEPYQRHVDSGRLVRRATNGYDHPDRGHVATWQVRITTKGLHELHRLMDGSGPLLLAARPEQAAS
jgi:anti-repressor protein